ncbi:hypothetical protein B0H14DRAFT_3466219 [Mycena olivaceomarginata]|nr:hypothetical protein B0H14DRAFT_3466219 [Mycena olivaceomarginata]
MDPSQHWVIDVSQHEFYTSALEIAQKIAQEDATPIPKLESDEKMDAAAAGEATTLPALTLGRIPLPVPLLTEEPLALVGILGQAPPTEPRATGETASQPATGGDGGAADTSNTPLTAQRRALPRRDRVERTTLQANSYNIVLFS